MGEKDERQEFYNFVKNSLILNITIKSMVAGIVQPLLMQPKVALESPTNSGYIFKLKNQMGT